MAVTTATATAADQPGSAKGPHPGRRQLAAMVLRGHAANESGEGGVGCHRQGGPRPQMRLPDGGSRSRSLDL